MDCRVLTQCFRYLDLPAEIQNNILAKYFDRYTFVLSETLSKDQPQMHDSGQEYHVTSLLLVSQSFQAQTLEAIINMTSGEYRLILDPREISLSDIYDGCLKSMVTGSYLKRHARRVENVLRRRHKLDAAIKTIRTNSSALVVLLTERFRKAEVLKISDGIDYLYDYSGHPYQPSIASQCLKRIPLLDVITQKRSEELLRCAYLDLEPRFAEDMKHVSLVIRSKNPFEQLQPSHRDICIEWKVWTYENFAVLSTDGTSATNKYLLVLLNLGHDDCSIRGVCLRGESENDGIEGVLNWNDDGGLKSLISELKQKESQRL